MFVLMHLRTNIVGTDVDEVYEFVDSTTDENLDDYAHDLAYDNAEFYGIEPDGFSDEEPFSGYWEKIVGKTREEIIEEYGSIIKG